MEEKISSFTQLIAWQKGRQLVLLIYKLTRSFPKDELFGITSQMRRCAVSITSNIAERFSRNSWKEKLQFYATALGSTTELQNQLIICRDVNYIQSNDFDVAESLSTEVNKIINGLIKKTKTMILIP